MKVFKILSHPYTLIICFLMIMISGEHVGGFYVVYLLLALPHGGIHSLLALAGIVILLTSYHQFKRRKSYRIETLLNMLGLVLLVLSVIFFFTDDRQHYNWGTFDQTVPVFTLFFTGFIGILFLIDNLSPGDLPIKINGSMTD